MPQGGQPYDDGMGPLDVSSILPQQAGPQPQPKPPNDKRQWLKLAALLPAAMKGGPGAVEGLLQGYQQAAATQQQQATADAATRRQTMLDTRAGEAQAFNQQQALAQQVERQQAARSGLVKEFSTAMLSPDLEDDEAVRALISLYESRGRELQMRPGTFEAAAMQMAKPSRLERTAAQRKVDGLRTQFGVANWQQEAAKFKHELPGGRLVSLDELLSMAGMPRQEGAPTAQTPQILPDVPLDRQHAQAIASGNEPLAKLIEQALSRQDATRRDPQRLPLQITVGGSGLTPTQITAAGGLRDDYRTQSKDFFAARDGYERVLASAEDPSPAGDVALLYGYMKLLDPNSVVRETEFATAARTGSLPQQIQAAAQRVVNGQRLTGEQRADFLNRARTLFGRAQARQNSRKQQYQGMATRAGVPSELVVVDDAPVDESVLGGPAPAPAGGGGSPADPLGIR